MPDDCRPVTSRPSIARALAAVALATGLLAACGSNDVALTGAAARGKAVAERAGCAACHGGTSGDATIGPAWVGSWGTQIPLDDGTTVLFDREYVISSVRDPDLHRREGDWLRMPAFRTDQLTDAELNEVVAYLQALGGDS